MKCMGWMHSICSETAKLQQCCKSYLRHRSFPWNISRFKKLYFSAYPWTAANMCWLLIFVWSMGNTKAYSSMYLRLFITGKPKKNKVKGRRFDWFLLTLIYHCRSSHRKCSLKKGVLKTFAKFTGKHLCQSLFFNFLKSLLKKWLRHRCFPVNFAKLL